MMNPTITTIAQPMYKIGSQACKMLIQKINDKSIQLENVIMDFELIIRESTMK